MSKAKATTTAADLDPANKEGPVGPGGSQGAVGETGDVTEPETPVNLKDEAAAKYREASDLVAKTTRKFSDAGMSGTEAGKLALQLFSTLFID